MTVEEIGLLSLSESNNNCIHSILTLDSMQDNVIQVLLSLCVYVSIDPVRDGLSTANMTQK